MQRTSGFWRALGVPDPSLREFLSVERLVGFFVTTSLEKFDVDLEEAQGVGVFFKRDWELLKAYRETISSYAKPHFLARLGITLPTAHTALRIAEGLIRSRGRRVASGDVGAADVYTFVVSPYEILDAAQVFRRDELPDLSPNAGRDYQRPLLPKKLAAMRQMLLGTQDFMFPSSILVVLSADCNHSRDHGLMIPKSYGAIEVIDGQHRLFSYASQEVERYCRSNAKLMVTAIHFQEHDPAQIRQYNGRTFVEINTTQTRVPASHVHAIAYSLLGDTKPRSLGAEVIIRLNARDGVIRGLFATSQTSLGPIQATTVLTVLHPLTNLAKLHALAHRSGASAHRRRQGLSNLLGLTTLEAVAAEDVVRLTTIALEHYLRIVHRTFQLDWPARGSTNTSSLAFAKMFAAFIRLMRAFIGEGLDWATVETELVRLRTNLLALRRRRKYGAVLLDSADPRIPGSGPSINQDFKFLQENRARPTPVQRVVARRGRR
jgi:DGQHR domain-containing protein